MMTNYSVFMFQTNCTPHLPKADKGMHSLVSLTKLLVVFLPNYIVQIKQEFNNLKVKWKSNRRLFVASFWISFEVKFHFDCNFFNTHTVSLYVICIAAIQGWYINWHGYNNFWSIIVFDLQYCTTWHESN